MKRNIITTLIVTLVVAGSAWVFAQVYLPEPYKNHIVSIVYENFEEENPADRFDLRFSPYGMSNKMEMKTYPYVPVGLGEIRKQSKNSMGINASFARKGANWLDLLPKKFKPFDGKVRAISCWFWGGNFAYNVDFVVEDYMGFYWPIPGGSLQHYGWKNHSVVLSGAIPQEEPYLPRRRGLAFKKFRFYANPMERSDRFHVFLDYMKYVTDTHKGLYDGWDLEEHLRETMYPELFGNEKQEN